MQFIYRLSPERPGGKPRPEWFSKELCLRNFFRVFSSRLGGPGADFLLLADRCDDKTIGRIYSEAVSYSFVSHQPLRLDYGQGGPAFLAALEAAVRSEPRDGLVYLVEDDYLHRPWAGLILREGLDLFDYVTLYDHPDKYMHNGPNELVIDGAESSRVYCTKSCHWKETNSTTMTFACKLETLRADADVFRQENQVVIPRDFKTFRRLVTQKGRRIGSPIPSWATHCESRWMAPLVDWEVVNHAGL